MDAAELQGRLDAGGEVTVPAGRYRGVADLRVPAGASLVGVGRVVFDGSRRIPNREWRTRGRLRWVPYEALPAEDGHGIRFTEGQNLADPLGVHADQVWSRGRALRRVSSRRRVRPGSFAVARGRLYVHPSDARRVCVSDARVFATVAGTVRGVTVARYSPTARDDAAVRLRGGTLERVRVRRCSFVPVSVSGRGARLVRCTISDAGWMGVAARLCDGLLLERVRVRRVNTGGVFLSAPQSGALKTSRCRDVSVLRCVVEAVQGHGLWFDQSNLDVHVAGCVVAASGHGVFFEISDGLLLEGSRVSAGGDAVKVAGGSGARLVGNELRGRNALGVYVDSRSLPGASDPRRPLAPGSYRSDRMPLEWWEPRLTWMPRVVELEGNVLVPDEVRVLTRNGSARSTRAAMLP